MGEEVRAATPPHATMTLPCQQSENRRNCEKYCLERRHRKTNRRLRLRHSRRETPNRDANSCRNVRSDLNPQNGAIAASGMSVRASRVQTFSSRTERISSRTLWPMASRKRISKRRRDPGSKAATCAAASPSQASRRIFPWRRLCAVRGVRTRASIRGGCREAGRRAGSFPRPKSAPRPFSWRGKRISFSVIASMIRPAGSASQGRTPHLSASPFPAALFRSGFPERWFLSGLPSRRFPSSFP